MCIRDRVDSAGITYVISSNCYQGALQYDEQGRFLGFYGSEKVTLSLETILNQFWKSILTEAQAANMKRSVPAEFVSFCVGDGDFIYTVRKGNDVQTAQVKKLNALGDNILPEKVFGDRGVTAQLADITVDPDGFITTVSYTHLSTAACRIPRHPTMNSAGSIGMPDPSRKTPRETISSLNR